MIIFVFDTDILSTFAKIDRLELLQKVFGDNKLLIPNAVVKDLKNAKLNTISEVTDLTILKNINLNKEEKQYCEKINYHRVLGRGETECIAVCKLRNGCFVSNDKKAIKTAEELNIRVLDLETILFSLKEILNKEELKIVLNDIESKDKVIIVNKDKILKS